MMGCACATCHSDDPRDRRLRPSIYVEADDGPAVLVDTGTDLRQQALTFGIARVDAMLFTHSHADHIMGLDEVRRFNALQRASMPCLRRSPPTADDLRRRFATSSRRPIKRRRCAAAGSRRDRRAIRSRGAARDSGAAPSRQQADPRVPLRGFAYLTDCNRIPEESWPLLDGPRRARHRRAAPPAASDAFHRSPRRSPSRRASAAADLFHPHLPRPAARRDQCEPSARAWRWPTTAWCSTCDPLSISAAFETVRPLAPLDAFPSEALL